MRSCGRLWRRTLAALALALLVGCGGSEPPAEPPVAATVDPVTQADRRLARNAFEARSYERAAVLYERVIARAYERDDLAMIADAGYELAVVELRRGRPEAAAQLARRTRAELARRGQEPFAELFLVEAVAVQRLGEPAKAEALLEQAPALAPDPKGPVGLRAAFLRGVIAADNRDATALRSQIERLAGSTEPTIQADRLELEGRLAGLDGRHQEAVAAFAATVELRRETRDLEGLAQALALGGEAALAAGDERQAADLYLRAGRSAQERDDAASAREWLGEAARIARSSGQDMVRREATERLSALAKAV